MGKKRMELPGTTVAFRSYTFEGIHYFEFDTAHYQPPEPMINLMYALKIFFLQVQAHLHRFPGLFLTGEKPSSLFTEWK